MALFLPIDVLSIGPENGQTHSFLFRDCPTTMTSATLAEKLLGSLQHTLDYSSFLYSVTFGFETDFISFVSDGCKVRKFSGSEEERFFLLAPGGVNFTCRVEKWMDRRPDNCWQIHVKAITGKNSTLSVPGSTTVEQFKFMYMTTVEAIAMGQQRLIFAGTQLLEDLPLEHYGITNGATLNLLVRLRGGEARVAEFVDMEAETKIRNWCFNAPDWRVACHGMNIELICQNRNCQAYNKQVIHQQHFEPFDLLLDCPYCPMCQQAFPPIKPGFFDCYWCFVGVKQDGSCVSKGWTRCDADGYTTFDEAEAGMAVYSQLVIRVRPLKQTVEFASMFAALSLSDSNDIQMGGNEEENKESEGEEEAEEEKEEEEAKELVSVPSNCAVCFKSLRLQGHAVSVLANCRHVYHRQCISNWVDGHHSCPLCRAPASAGQVVDVQLK
eukprot:GILI01005689.1.p1 GENE.GILI01005689.1~~GILI01005689.1.p1  ORF type:complete len:453 (+),score=84.81 GILI01005689.1:43-1359(+)